VAAIVATNLDVEKAVNSRYSNGAQRREASLCCPVDYDRALLEVIPHEVLQRDYGCGDPTPYVRPGDVVLDLGSGGGKLCFMVAQLVGSAGRVTGVDANPDMLALARGAQPVVAERLGYDNVRFLRGRIQDLGLDLDLLDRELKTHPVIDASSWIDLRSREERLRRESPLVPDDSVDIVLSNCVLNLVHYPDRTSLFNEIFRVLRRGGRVAISDIVCDEDVPEDLKGDPKLWSGCISGAFREDRFLEAFEQAGFHGMTLAKRQEQPWQTVRGIEFRSVTVVAYKGKQGPCLERKQALVYQGPFRKVEDDDGHVFHRGRRTAVCDKTFHLLQREPYAGQFAAVEPREAIPLDQAAPFNCRPLALSPACGGRDGEGVRHPRETKGQDYNATTEAAADCCGSEGCC